MTHILISGAHLWSSIKLSCTVQVMAIFANWFHFFHNLASQRNFRAPLNVDLDVLQAGNLFTATVKKSDMTLQHIPWCWGKENPHDCQPYTIVFYWRTLSPQECWTKNSIKHCHTAMEYNLSRTEPGHNKTNKVTVCPAKFQISLGICPVWSESSLCAWWVAKHQSFLHADSKDSVDQTVILLVLPCHGSIKTGVKPYNSPYCTVIRSCRNILPQLLPE